MVDNNKHPNADEDLIAAWHAHRLRDRNSSFFTDDKFVEWLASEERVSPEATTCTGFSNDEILDVARSLQAHAAAAKSRISRVVGAPIHERPIIPGVPMQVAEAASSAGYAPFVDLGVAAGIGRELWDEECSSWVRLPPGIPKGTYVALTVHGESMLPLLHSGDVMVVRLDSDYSSGDIIVARLEDDGFVVKRVGRVTPHVTELDSINPAFGSAKIPRSSQFVVGTVILCWCDHQSPPT